MSEGEYSSTTLLLHMVGNMNRRSERLLVIYAIAYLCTGLSLAVSICLTVYSPSFTAAFFITMIIIGGTMIASRAWLRKSYLAGHQNGRYDWMGGRSVIAIAVSLLAAVVAVLGLSALLNAFDSHSVSPDHLGSIVLGVGSAMLTTTGANYLFGWKTVRGEQVGR